MLKTEQTNGGSILKIGEFFTDEEKEIKMPPEKAKKLTIASIANLEKLEQEGILEIEVGTHEVYKEGDRIVKRIINGKEIAPKEDEEMSK